MQLTNQEIEDIIQIKSNLIKNSNGKSVSLGEIFEAVKLKFPDFDYKSNNERNKLIMNVIDIDGGNIRNNKPLNCPKCDGKYIVSYLYGDVFYRLFNGSNEQKQKERERFEKMGLFINSSPYKQENNDKSYLCLNCGNEW